MNRGLASLPTQRFQSGGPAIGLGGLTAPVASIGPVGLTPADIGIAALSAMNAPVAAPLAAVNTAINAMNALAAMNAEQSPAPVSSVEGQIAATAAQEATDAVDAAEGLAAMNAANAEAQAAEDAATADAAATAAMADAVADSVAAADAADAAAAAGDAGGGGGDGGGDGGAGAAGDAGGGSGDASGDGSGGERAGGLIGRKHYQFGGSVMGMGDAAPRYAYAPIMMAEGGLAAAAQNIQNRGRGNDTMLVHMTPGEVKGLQALAMAQGGSLTINPDTGLPEAGILSSLLPMVAGFALGPAGFGLMSSLQAGLTVGALTGIATGSLKKGLMAGLGAYGGAGVGEGLVGAGGGMPTGAPPLTAEAAADWAAGPGMAGPNAMPPDVASGRFVDEALAKKGLAYNPTGGPLIEMPPDVASGSFADQAIAKSGYTYNPTGGPLIKMPDYIDSSTVVPGYPGGQIPTATGAPTAFDTAQKGFSEVFKPGEAGKAARAAFSKTAPFGAMYAAAAPVVSAAMEPPKGPTPSPAFIRPYTFASNPMEGAYTPSPRPGDTSERRYFNPTFTPLPIYQAAEGGQVDPDYDMNVGQNSSFSDGYAPGGSVSGLEALAKKRRAAIGDKLYKFADSRRDQSMEAALEQNFARGGALPPRFLSGGGDGMSDSIKANIDGKQEARLADGEFVVPADVVSHLGNGSSKAGAKKLYAMMDKIRKARAGSKRQAPEVNAGKYMPA